MKLLHLPFVMTTSAGALPVNKVKLESQLKVIPAQQSSRTPESTRTSGGSSDSAFPLISAAEENGHFESLICSKVTCHSSRNTASL